MIRITRKKGSILWNIGRFRSYKIYIDGVCHGRIWLGETREFPVKNGGYTVYASARYSGVPLFPREGEYKSKSLDVVVNDSIVELEVGNALTGWKRWLFPYSSISIEKGEFLFLKEKEADEPQEG